MEEVIINCTSIERTKDSSVRHYTKHLKEQLVFPEYVYNDILPEFIANVSVIERIGKEFMESNEMSKNDWMFLYDVVKKMTDAAPQDKEIITFTNKFLIGKYKEKHSTFYYVEAKLYIKSMLAQIEESKQHDPSDEKEFNLYVARMYTAAQHLYFFINVKEKLSVEE